ncbi:hypothetical protein Pla52o_00250 [Novipirellula galeiformis]|uniref:Uncharacterized protein n=1 Tax=Novipirellula galeiformis TaxID=2528004 RepID=A0A5C6CML3_9BACT|nr:hypothetical protein [Novipirellula galeiformis]TWU26173.1 hypothetical protein Pla52o_00250 [Novipirellula galeiformis]
MTTDDFLLDQLERTQQDQTRRRRENRNQRRRYYVLGGVFLIAFLLLAAPSLISHSPIGKSIVVRSAAAYGFDAKAQGLRVGWVTPLRINGLTVIGNQAGSQIRIEQIDTELTVLDLLGSTTSELGSILVRGVDASCKVSEGNSSIEEDLQYFLEQPASDGPATTGNVEISDITLTVTDEQTGETWKLSQASTQLDLLADSIQSRFTGVLAEPRGSQGSLQGAIEFGFTATTDPSHASPWNIDLTCDSLPLSVVSLVRRRMSTYADQIPAQLVGDATGNLQVRGSSDGSIDAVVRQFQVRNLEAANLQQDSRRWTNKLAMLDGQLSLIEDRVMGRGLVATTDFASIKLDGAFSTSITLVGASDNPVRWLDALEGTASAELDLAAMDRALPGILPIRSDAELVSGRAIAAIESLPSHDVRRRRLSLRSDAIRARSHGQAVVIDPVEMTAIVSSNPDRIQAEQFELKSTFAAASGKGNLQSGATDIEVDFGRLASMLRPIIDLSSSSLAGSARGKIQWNASGGDQWRLTGTADAKDLLIELPGGNRLRHPALRMNVDAVGQWHAGRLESLSVANAVLSSSGLNLRAELVQGIRSPNADTRFPLRIQGDGRLESLADTLGPWLPEELHDFDGGFTMNARADISSRGGRLTGTSIELTQPRVAYADRYFAQPKIKLHFNGDYDWAAASLDCRSMTVEGDAMSAAIQGEWTPTKTDLEIAWRAKLERIQGSVKTRVATRVVPAITQVGYRPGQNVPTDEWLVMGDCDGRFIITSQSQQYSIDTEFTGTGVAIVQPPQASAAWQTVGPVRNATGATGANGNPSSTSIQNSGSRVVWSEPNVKINGMMQFDPQTGTVAAPSLKLASDWFATNLAGHAIWNESQGEVSVKGPTRIKMDEVAKRLSDLAGTQIQMQGVQETPIELKLTRQADDQIAMEVLANLGWESGEVAGVKLGRANIPVRLTETSVYISPASVPVDQGRLNLAGDVHYRPGPLWMRVAPGRVAESIRLTPEMTDRWLKYLAPLAANATRVDGTLSAEIDEAIVVFDHPQQSRVIGRLNIESINMNSGPMADQIIGGLHQLRSLAQLTVPQAASNNETTLIRVPAQTVDFSLDRGVVSHQRMFFEVDRAQVVTSGNVNIDGRLNLIAQVPLDARWLGSDLQGLAGQPVTLPIDGTLSRPSLDSSGVRKVVSELSLQAVQGTAENYLQKQLGRGLDKIFGR